MGPLEAALVVVVLAAPGFWLIRRQFSRLDDPSFLREHGVVIVEEWILEGHAASIGDYMGHPIWESVHFRGMRYRFDRVIDARLREKIKPRELFLEPGLVYVTD
jgi:hypothetical protein